MSIQRSRKRWCSWPEQFKSSDAAPILQICIKTKLGGISSISLFGSNVQTGTGCCQFGQTFFCREGFPKKSLRSQRINALNALIKCWTEKRKKIMGISRLMFKHADMPGLFNSRPVVFFRGICPFCLSLQFLFFGSFVFWGVLGQLI